MKPYSYVILKTTLNLWTFVHLGKLPCFAGAAISEVRSAVSSQPGTGPLLRLYEIISVPKLLNVFEN
jgi:hypothetical protein